MDNDQITLSQALSGFEIYVRVRRLSPHTLFDYFNTYNKFQKFLGDDLPLAAISKRQVQEFLDKHHHLSKKTILNYHTGLSSLWRWALEEELVEENIIRKIAPPDPEKPEINPFTEQDVKLMLLACEKSVVFSLPNHREKARYTLPNAKRNRAIILTLLDTGLRASELCNLTAAKLDMKNKQIVTYGKGDKQRILEMSSQTTQAIWRYLIKRPKLSDASPIFVGNHNLPLKRGGLLQLIKRIGERAGVRDAHPHRFRHTFAINFLRNGGNIYALQKQLGHSSLDMVKRYLKLSEQDCASVHRIASPVANWNL